MTKILLSMCWLVLGAEVPRNFSPVGLPMADPNDPAGYLPAF